MKPSRPEAALGTLSKGREWPMRRGCRDCHRPPSAWLAREGGGRRHVASDFANKQSAGRPGLGRHKPEAGIK
jgi:hypothetical protein